MWWEFALIGLGAGFAAGYLGIGGGLIIVPPLMLVFSRDPATAPVASHLAVATSLATMLATSASSIWAHHRRRAVRWATVKTLAPGLALGALVGAWLADQVSTEWLARVFGAFALLAGLQLLFLGRDTGDVDELDGRLPGRTVQGAVGGLIGGVSSLVGIGGGSLTAPWLMAHGVRAQAAVATAAACGYPIALAGTAAFAWLGRTETAGVNSLGYVHLPALIGIAAFSVLAAPLGARAVHNSPPHWVRRAFGVLLLLVAGRLLAG